MKKSICIFLIIINTLFGPCLPAGRFGIFLPAEALAKEGDLGFANEYMLASGDQLEVRLLGQKDLDTKQSIAPDGTISLPFLGRIPASSKI